MSLALVLFAFIYLVERHTLSTSDAVQPPPPLLDFKPDQVTSVQLRRDGELTLRVDRTNGLWQLTFPLHYPAQTLAVEGMLEELRRLDRGVFLTPQELAERDQSLADFNLEVPVASLVLQAGEERVEIRFGSKTPVGDRAYVQVQNARDVFVVNGSALDRLPRHPNEWRDPSLINLRSLRWDRLEVRTPSRDYAIQKDLTNRVYYLSKPTPARADNPKVDLLLSAIQGSRVLEFVEDHPRADWESYGLSAPGAVLVVGMGTNELASIRFGHSPTNHPGAVYALWSAYTNVVLVPLSLLETLQTSHADLREKRLLPFVPEAVGRVEIVGSTNLVLVRQGEEAWGVLEPQPLRADIELVRQFFGRLGALEGQVERDLVTDFSSYGLAPPSLQYRLFSVVTNAEGLVTNQLVGQLDFGTQQEGKVFARRIDEQSVYSVPHTDYEQLPRQAWQIRERRIWRFATNEIARVLITTPDQEVVLLRSGPARWQLAPGSQGIINDLAIEETIYRLGQLDADYWVARGEEQRAQYGLRKPLFAVTVELKDAGDAPRQFRVEFGQPPPDQFPYALTQLDGQACVFEFPKKLYFEIVRDLLKPFWKGPALPL